MVSFQKAKFRAGGVAVLAGMALVLAACGSSSSSSGSNASAPSYGSGAAPASTSQPASLSIGTAKSSDGTYLTGASGRTLYLWVADHNGKSVCSGECAKAWPPVITKGTPKTSAGVNAADVGTVKRSDGSLQVTYKGHPLYYFIEDSKAGMTTGQGSDGFGAKWWLVAPSGSAITTSGTSSAAASSNSASASSGSSGGSSGGSSSSSGGWG
jgi:predicted lipoprotein with Yx(FWY)xxD motif